MGHETFGSGKINAFEDIGPAEQHFLPHGLREFRMRIDGDRIEQVHGIGPEHRPGRFIGKIVVETLRQEPYQVLTRHGCTSGLSSGRQISE